MSKLKGLTNYQISKMMSGYEGFLGVYMDDETSRIPMKNIHKGRKAFICNLQTSFLEGSHWTCCLMQGDKAWYIDTFGVVPCIEVSKWLTDNFKNVEYNDFDIQDYNSDSCGWMCCMICQLFLGNKNTSQGSGAHVRNGRPEGEATSVGDILKHLNGYPHENEKKCEKYFNK